MDRKQQKVQSGFPTAIVPLLRAAELVNILGEVMLLTNLRLTDAALVGDVSEADFKCSLIPFEIGSRGLIVKPNKTCLMRLLRTIKTHTKYSTLKTIFPKMLDILFLYFPN